MWRRVSLSDDLVLELCRSGLQKRFVRFLYELLCPLAQKNTSEEVALTSGLHSCEQYSITVSEPGTGIQFLLGIN